MRSPYVIGVDDIPVRERFDFWWEAIARSVIALEASSVQPDAFWGEIRVAEFGVMQVSQVRCTPCQTRRTARHIRRSDPGLYQLSLILHGQSAVQQRGREVALRPMDLTLYDTSHPFHGWTASNDGATPQAGSPSQTSFQALVVQFPFDVVPISRPEAERLTVRRLSARAGIGALLLGLLQRLIEQDNPYAPTDGVRVATIVLDLVAALLAQEFDEASKVPLNDFRKILLMRVQAFIEQRLDEPDLCPSLIAAAHHISVRHLHKVFEEEGTTVAAWIRKRRLERCRRCLADPAWGNMSAWAIASRWGFASESHFNRLFSAAYGTPPAAYRRRLHASMEFGEN